MSQVKKIDAFEQNSMQCPNPYQVRKVPSILIPCEQHHKELTDYGNTSKVTAQKFEH